MEQRNYALHTADELAYILCVKNRRRNHNKANAPPNAPRKILRVQLGYLLYDYRTPTQLCEEEKVVKMGIMKFIMITVT